MKSLFFVILFLSYSIQALQVSNLSTIEKLEPGERKRIQLTLINDKDAEESVELKLADYSCNSQGDHFYDEPDGKKSRSNASWILLGQNRVLLAPREERDIYFIVEAPTDLSDKGSFWSCLLIEPTESFSQSDAEGFTLHVKIRFAHHIVTQVGDASPKVKVIKKEIKELDGVNYFCVHVINQGELFYNPNLTLTFYDDQGNLQKQFKSEKERLYPGCSQCFYVNVSDYPKEKLIKPLQGFILFDGNDSFLFGDRFSYP